jgi:hypothetical protein
MRCFEKKHATLRRGLADALGKQAAKRFRALVADGCGDAFEWPPLAHQAACDR